MLYVDAERQGHSSFSRATRWVLEAAAERLGTRLKEPLLRAITPVSPDQKPRLCLVDTS
jgi:hypothetical protein